MTSTSRTSYGFALPELMITVVILGILAGVGSVGLINSSRVWGLRNAAVELAGYLDKAQAQAAANQDQCVVAITGTGASQQIGPTTASPNSCSGLPPALLLPASPIPLNLNPAAGTTTFTIASGGTVPATLTTRLSATGTSAELCVQVLAPAAQVAIGIYKNPTCDHAAFN
jgi:prepilin-type N-terminal cleavage/methylation domain-containing protein